MLHIVDSSSDSDSTSDLSNGVVIYERGDEKIEASSAARGSSVCLKLRGAIALRRSVVLPVDKPVPRKSRKLAIHRPLSMVRRSTRPICATDRYYAEPASGKLNLPKVTPFKARDKVFARFRAPSGKKWFVAHVSAVDDTKGTAELAYTDGDRELCVSPEFMIAAPHVHPDAVAASKKEALNIVEQSCLDLGEDDVVATLATLPTALDKPMDFKKGALENEIAENRRMRTQTKDEYDEIHSQMSRLAGALKIKASTLAFIDRQGAALMDRHEKMARLEQIQSEAAQLQRELA